MDTTSACDTAASTGSIRRNVSAGHRIRQQIRYRKEAIAHERKHVKSGQRVEAGGATCLCSAATGWSFSKVFRTQKQNMKFRVLAAASLVSTPEKFMSTPEKFTVLALVAAWPLSALEGISRRFRRTLAGMLETYPRRRRFRRNLRRTRLTLCFVSLRFHLARACTRRASSIAQQREVHSAIAKRARQDQISRSKQRPYVGTGHRIGYERCHPMSVTAKQRCYSRSIPDNSLGQYRARRRRRLPVEHGVQFQYSYLVWPTSVPHIACRTRVSVPDVASQQGRTRGACTRQVHTSTAHRTASA